MPISPIDPAPAALVKQCRANGAIRIAAFEGYLNPVMRAMFERVRKRESERSCASAATESSPNRRRISAKKPLGACSGLRPNLLLMG